MKGQSVKIRFIGLISGMVLSASLAFAQGACYPAGTVVLDTGRPANSASVRVCTSGSTGTPCTPAASLFTDPTLGTPLVGSPTITTDARGNYGFCAAAGVNYDLQISGTGITPLTIKNLPLPPTTPIAAASLTSSSANPANVGLIKLASSDCLDWRNNANTGNIQLCKTTADALDLTAFGAVNNSNFAIPTTSNTLPATITNDTAGGILFTNNAGLSFQFGNGGTIFLNSSSGIRWKGATSGNTVVQASAVAGSGTLTLPGGVNDTLVCAACTQTLGGKTLSSPAITSPSVSDPTISGNTNLKRIKANQGSSLVVGDVALSGGWGTTASVTLASGSDAAGQINILSNGTGQAANATFTLTFHDGTWTTAPLCLVIRADGNSPSGAMIPNAPSATAVTFFFSATPVAATTYSADFICLGR